MGRLLFTHSYFYRFDPKQWSNKRPYPPLATITVASAMRNMGHNVSLFDTALEHGPQKLPELLKTVKPNYLVIYDDGFNWLTKMCLTNMREAAFEMIKMGKEHGCKVIVSSSDSTDHFDQYLSEGADFVILGEGDLTLKELITKLDNGEEITDTKGLTFKENGNTINTGNRPVLRNLDSLPMAAWDLIDIPAYRNIWMEGNGYFSLNLGTTRGCPFKCNWCAKPIYGNRYNVRSAAKVVDEIEYLINNYGPTHFWMSDDIFGLKPRWAQQFNAEVKKRELKFKYMIQSRADLLLEEDTMAVLAESGLEEVWIGAESGSQKILDAMAKGTKIEQIYEATRVLKSVGVRVAFFIQFGYIGETEKNIQETIKMITDLMPDNIGISVSYPLPGTVFYDLVKQDLQDKANWTDSDDLDLMFENKYSPKFYKRLHRYVHKVYRRKQGFQNGMLMLKNPSQIDISKVRSLLATAYYIPAAMLESFNLKRLRGK